MSKVRKFSKEAKKHPSSELKFENTTVKYNLGTRIFIWTLGLAAIFFSFISGEETMGFALGTMGVLVIIFLIYLERSRKNT